MNTKMVQLLGKSLQFFIQLDIDSPYDSAILLLRIYTEQNESLCSHKKLYMNTGYICNCPELEMTQLEAD